VSNKILFSNLNTQNKKGDMAMNEKEMDMLSRELDLSDLDFEFVEDKDLEEVAGGIKLGSIYIETTK